MKFDRIVRVQIDIPGQADIEFSDLKMNFRVSKTETSDINTCELSIFNLNSDSRNKINLKNAELLLYAGYQDETGDELIFTGDITTVNNITQRPNVVTKIEAGDGEKKLSDVKASISFKENVSVFQVVKQALSKFDLPIKTQELLEPLKKIKLNNGQSFSGRIKTLLDTLFLGVNMDWSIQNGEIKFYAEGQTDQTFGVELTTETGLLDSPERIKIKKSKRDETPEIDGWRFKSLLSPKIEPGGTVIVQSNEISERSQYKVLNVEHTGDSFEGEFFTVIEAIQYE